MPLKFDNKGYLYPYNAIETNLNDLQEYFVNRFSASSTRREIFTNLQTFFLDFKKEICAEFTVWINGSFVTQKENPNDIDLLIFINFEELQHKEVELKRYNTLQFKNITKIDVYYIIVFPEQNSQYRFFLSDKLYWQNQFSKTAKNRKGKSFEKGFLEINIS